MKKAEIIKKYGIGEYERQQAKAKALYKKEGEKYFELISQWRKDNPQEIRIALPKNQQEDECPQCGDVMVSVEDNIVYCEKCNQYFKMKEDGAIAWDNKEAGGDTK